MRIPAYKTFLWTIGGVCLGWGGARVVPYLAEEWPLLQTYRLIFRNAVPVWLWGSVLIGVGTSILLAPSLMERLALNRPSPQSSASEGPVASESERRPPAAIAHLEPEQNTDENNTKHDLSGRGGEQSHTERRLPDEQALELQKAKAWAQHPRPFNLQRNDSLKIVAIGGGTGMPQLLRGLRAYTDHITAIVTVADDGGSSGRLRFMGILPPGDFRNNIAALSDSEELITRLFQYRFAHGESPRGQADKTGLAGHNFGNIFIATMAAVTGSFESGLAESSRVLAVRGRVLPSTLEQVTLCAEIRRIASDADPSSTSETRDEWLLVEGESAIPKAGGAISRVFLKPQQVRAYPEAIRAILQADLILAGPGSFFTSIIPNLLVPAVRDAILSSSAPSLYLCNVATQPGETDFYSVSDHMLQLYRHAGKAFTSVLANYNYDPGTNASAESQWVTLPRSDRSPGYVSDIVDGNSVEYQLFTGDLVSATNPAKHDTEKLASRVLEVYQELRTQT